MTVDVRALVDGELVHAGWALNEASVEKATRQRMLEVLVEVDDRPLSRWGCDGVVCATPTGSTAYAFSAGGPVVWPDVAALLLVPISAHALFARPLVVSPSSVLAVEAVEARGDGGAVVRRPAHLRVPPGSRVEVRRGDPPCCWRGCTRRRSPTGWSASSGCRSPGGAAPHAPPSGRVSGRTMWEEIRLRRLGVIDEASLTLGPGFTAVTGETGAGKTMVVTALALLQGGRADSGLVRDGSGQARIEGTVVLSGLPAAAAVVEEAGGELEDGVGHPGAHRQRGRAGTLARTSRRRNGAGRRARRSRPAAGDRPRPVRAAPAAPPAAQREALDRFAGEPVAGLLSDYRPAYGRLARARAELGDLVAREQERAREMDALRHGLDEIARRRTAAR